MFIPDTDLQKTYYGITTMTGVGSSPGFEVHGGGSATMTICEFNIFNIAKDIYIKIMEW